MLVVSTVAALGAAVVQPASLLNLAGEWDGTLVTDSGRFRLRLNISGEGNERLAGEMTSLDQGDAKVPLADISVAGRTVHLSLPSIKGSYDALLDPDGNRMEGDWAAQGGRPVGLSFHRAGVAATSLRPLPFGPPLGAHVAISPVAFRAEGRTRIAYELWLTNLGRTPLRIKRVAVLDHSASVAEFEGSTLDSIFQQLAGRNTDSGGIDPGCVAVVRIWISVPRADAHPLTLTHRVVFDNGQAIVAAPVTVATREPLILAAPLRGGVWRALNGPGPGSGHWATMIASDGAGRFPDRFAIDWVRLGADGKTFAGDRSRNENFHAYGQPILAVANGVVVAAKDGIAENVAGTRAVTVTPETVCGNHVTVRLAEHQFAFYCHLQPASIRVRTGQRVRRGQVLGLIGNSGDSSEPHLHFQVSDRNSVTASEGLPYLLESYEVVDSEPGTVRRRRELPERDQHVPISPMMVARVALEARQNISSGREDRS